MKIFYISLATVVIVFGSAFGYFYYIQPRPNVDDVARAISGSNYQSALQLSDQIQNSPFAADDTKALARITVALFPYEVSGKREDALTAVQTLKEVAADT